MRIHKAFVLSPLPVLASLILSGCAVPPPNPMAQTANREQELKAAQEAMKEIVDGMLVSAIKAGKAIVVTTTVNLDSQKWGDFSDPNVSAEFLRARSGVTEWRNVNDPTQSFKVGNGQSADDTKSIKGSHLQVTFGRTLYQLFVVEPGTYTLAGASNVLPRTVLANPTANSQIRRSALGSVVMDETSFTEFSRGQEWRDATYRTDRVRQSVCTSVRVVNGECMSTADTSYDQVRQTGAAGYASVTKSKDVEGVVANASLRKPFATFTVGNGEVVLVDGFYPDAPTATFAAKDCERVASTKVSCEMSKFTMIRVPTSLKDFSQTMPASEQGLPKTEVLLKSIQYRQPKIFAAPGSSTTNRWGQEYALSER